MEKSLKVQSVKNTDYCVCLNNFAYLMSLFMGLLDYIFDIFSIGSGRVRVVLTVFASINVWTESLRN